MLDELEGDALAYGGRQLLDDIRGEALAYVDGEHPWDGRGDEPAGRMSAYLGVLWQRVEQERCARIGTMIPTRDGRWRVVQPARCPNGHLLGPHRVLVGWSPCPCRGHATWTCRTCDAMIYHPEPRDGCREVGIG